MSCPAAHPCLMVFALANFDLDPSLRRDESGMSKNCAQNKGDLGREIGLREKEIRTKREASCKMRKSQISVQKKGCRKIAKIKKRAKKLAVHPALVR